MSISCKFASTWVVAVNLKEIIHLKKSFFIFYYYYYSILFKRHVSLTQHIADLQEGRVDMQKR